MRKISIRGVSYNETTVFHELSCADLHWEEIPKILAAANGHIFSSDQLKIFNYFEKCKV